MCFRLLRVSSLTERDMSGSSFNPYMSLVDYGQINKLELGLPIKFSMDWVSSWSHIM